MKGRVLPHPHHQDVQVKEIRLPSKVMMRHPTHRNVQAKKRIHLLCQHLASLIQHYGVLIPKAANPLPKRGILRVHVQHSSDLATLPPRVRFDSATVGQQHHQDNSSVPSNLGPVRQQNQHTPAVHWLNLHLQQDSLRWKQSPILHALNLPPVHGTRGGLNRH